MLSNISIDLNGYLLISIDLNGYLLLLLSDLKHYRFLWCYVVMFLLHFFKCIFLVKVQPGAPGKTISSPALSDCQSCRAFPELIKVTSSTSKAHL